MMFLNEYEVKNLAYAFESDTPNLQRLAKVLDRLVNWANRTSDGWAYWPVPARAAANLMEVLNSAYSEFLKGNVVNDVTAQDVRDLLRPIKSMLTRMGASHEEVFNGS